MTERTRQEIARALAYLRSDGPDREGARRGLEDWFYQSLVEDGLMDRDVKAKGTPLEGWAKQHADPPVMDLKHEQHLQGIKDSFCKQVDKRYRTGAEEHGGFILDKAGLIDEAIEEAIDLYVYLVSVKEQMEGKK